MKYVKPLIFLCLTFAFVPVYAQQNESQGVVWDLSDLYATDEAWEAAFARSEAAVDDVLTLKGTLGDSAQAMANGLDLVYDTYKELVRVYIYTSLHRDEDQRDTDAQASFARSRQLYSEYEEAVSWIDPEILAIGEDRVRSFLASEPDLEKYTFLLSDILRRAPHTLDANTEALLAQASLVLSAPSQIYDYFANADIPWPTVTLSTGEEVQLNQSGYSYYRAQPNREDRKLVFDTFWQTWEQYADGMGAVLSTEVQSNVFSARARSHDSVLAQNLFSDGLPPEIYTQLVEQVNAALPTFHRYLELRGRILGIEDLRYYDIYPPMVDADIGEFDLERTKVITLDALSPFGKEYIDLLSRGLSADWMHSHPQPGKDSGAYMQGSAYDVHPYILLNHFDDFDSVSTFAHEWGHAVHSLLANAANPWVTADYSTFTAEMASTINEILLQEYMIENAKTDQERLFYLDASLEAIRGTLFRQTMFAEFELAIHEVVENGEPLTGAVMNEIYGDLLRRYHGHDEGVMTIDDTYAVEWAYIPHFYRDFYVFQYATSITGAAWFAEKFLGGEDSVRDDFLNVLRAGGSDYPHNILLNEAGLDLTQPEAYEPVLRRMESLMDRIEAIIEE